LNSENRFKIIFLVLIITTVLSVSFFGIWIDPYVKDVDFKGVKNISVIEYTYENNNWNELDFINAQFDGNDNMIFEDRFDAENNLQYSYEYIYDVNGYMIEVNGRRNREGGTIYYNYIYDYDERGNQIKGTGYDIDGNVISIYSAEYDENDNLIKTEDFTEGYTGSMYEARYDENDNLISESKYIAYEYKGEQRYQFEYRNEFVYDERNNVIEEITYGDEKEFSFNHIYEYDENNNLIKALDVDINGNVLSTYEAWYDDNGNMIEFKMFDKNGKLTTHNKAKYKENKMIKETDCLGDEEVVISITVYNENDNLIEQTILNKSLGEPFLEKYKYVYDDRDNVIEEIYYVYFEDIESWKAISKQKNIIEYK